MQIHILSGNKGIFSTSKKSQIDGYCTDCKVKQKFFKRMLKFIHFNGMLVGEQLPNSALHQGYLKRPRLTNHHNVSMGCFLKNEYCLALPKFFLELAENVLDLIWSKVYGFSLKYKFMLCYVICQIVLRHLRGFLFPDGSWTLQGMCASQLIDVLLLFY